MKKIKALLFIISVSLVLGISASCSTDSSSSESSDLDYSLVTKPSLLEETTGGFSQVRLYSQSKDDLSKYNFQSIFIPSPFSFLCIPNNRTHSFRPYHISFQHTQSYISYIILLTDYILSQIYVKVKC